MEGLAAVVNLARRTLRRLEEQLGPDDPGLKEIRASILRAIAELEFVRRAGSPLSKTA
jgi:hypothetical protein